MILFFYLRAAFRITVFLLSIFITSLIQAPLLWITKGPASDVIPRIWYRFVVWLFGVQLDIMGTPHKTSQTLYISNHMSSIDVAVLGGLVKGCMISRGDVRDWPILGPFSRLAQTIYVARKRSSVQSENNILSNTLKSGKNLIMFPEGTSSDGRTVLPFKSAFFAMLFDPNTPKMMVQPISIILKSVNGQKPERQEIRDLYAWHTGMDESVPEHLWRFASTSGAHLQIIFHPPLNPHDFKDRKSLAQRCEEIVSRALNDN